MSKLATIEEIAQDVYKQMDVHDISMVKSLNGKSDMIRYHHNVGRSIRNHYKLWEEDCPLTKGDIWADPPVMPRDPDEVSHQILMRVWELCR